MNNGKPKDFHNQHEWRVIGMSRSGNHAIIQWLLAQAQGRTCFLNCTEPKNNPFSWPRCLGDGRAYLASYPEFDLQRERSGDFSRKDYLIYSHEDVFLGLLRRGPWEEERDDWVGRSAERRDILILRDPFNLFASRMKAGIGTIPLHTAVRIWKQHAKEFLGRQQTLPEPPVCISYNDWVAKKSYRREAAERLGLTFSDAGRHRVPTTAGGSSFDSLRHRRRASKMRVFDRWKEFFRDDSYRSLFDAQMMDLSETIFGRLPAAERLAQRRRRRTRRAAASAQKCRA